jgi:hypothetical protein
MLPRIYGDFHKLDDENRICLTTVGTKQDLERLGIQLQEGMALTFYMDDADDQGNSDDIMVDGRAHFSESDNRWVGTVDWANVYHASEITGNGTVNGTSGQDSAKVVSENVGVGSGSTAGSS